MIWQLIKTFAHYEHLLVLDAYSDCGDWLVGGSWCLTPLSAIFLLYRGGDR